MLLPQVLQLADTNLASSDLAPLAGLAGSLHALELDGAPLVHAVLSVLGALSPLTRLTIDQPAPTAAPGLDATLARLPSLAMLSADEARFVCKMCGMAPQFSLKAALSQQQAKQEQVRN